MSLFIRVNIQYSTQFTHHLVGSQNNDLWKYKVNENTWTWMSGVDLSVRKGKYGEKGKASVENFPPARADAIGFYDSSAQEFWLFGGAARKDLNIYIRTHLDCDVKNTTTH